MTDNSMAGFLNKNVDISFAISRKEVPCALCGETIEKKERKYILTEKVNGKKKVSHCHFHCYNSAANMCSYCDDECNLSFVDCFKKNTKTISLEEVMDKIKFLFENVENIKCVEFVSGCAIFHSYGGAIVGNINLKAIFGENCILPNDKTIYRDWYNEERK